MGNCISEAKTKEPTKQGQRAAAGTDGQPKKQPEQKQQQPHQAEAGQKQQGETQQGGQASDPGQQKKQGEPLSPDQIELNANALPSHANGEAGHHQGAAGAGDGTAAGLAAGVAGELAQHGETAAAQSAQEGAATAKSQAARVPGDESLKQMAQAKAGGQAKAGAVKPGQQKPGGGRRSPGPHSPGATGVQRAITSSDKSPPSPMLSGSMEGSEERARFHEDVKAKARGNEAKARRMAEAKAAESMAAVQREKDEKAAKVEADRIRKEEIRIASERAAKEARAAEEARLEAKARAQKAKQEAKEREKKAQAEQRAAEYRAARKEAEAIQEAERQRQAEAFKAAREREKEMMAKKVEVHSRHMDVHKQPNKAAALRQSAEQLPKPPPFKAGGPLRQSWGNPTGGSLRQSWGNPASPAASANRGKTTKRDPAGLTKSRDSGISAKSGDTNGLHATDDAVSNSPPPGPASPDVASPGAATFSRGSGTHTSALMSAGGSGPMIESPKAEDVITEEVGKQGANGTTAHEVQPVLEQVQHAAGVPRKGHLRNSSIHSVLDAGMPSTSCQEMMPASVTM